MEGGEGSDGSWDCGSGHTKMQTVQNENIKAILKHKH